MNCTCRNPETCLNTACASHPEHPFNRWGAGAPAVEDDSPVLTAVSWALVVIAGLRIWMAFGGPK